MHPLPVVIPPLGPTNHNHHYIADYARGVPDSSYKPLDCVWNVMAHAQKPDFVFRRNGQVHLNRRGNQFSRLLAGELCTSACRVCTARASLCSAVMWRLLPTPFASFLFTSPVRHRVPSHFKRSLQEDASLLTLRWLMSYIYGAPILDVSRSHTTTQHSR